MRILVTAGPTREPIDAVRFISNRSSGKMGLAIAQAGIEAGHDVTLLYGPGIVSGERFDSFPFETTRQLHALLMEHWPHDDLLIMAAAVADYQMPGGDTETVHKKLPRNEGLTLHLEPTEDLVAAMVKNKRPDQRIIAFALEEKEHLEPRAMEKLQRKGVDAIVANALDTMNAEAIEALWLTARGERQSFVAQDKIHFARQLMVCCEAL